MKLFPKKYIAVLMSVIFISISLSAGSQTRISFLQELRSWSTLTPVFDIAVSPDGRSLLTGERPNIARLWDTQSGRPLKKFIGHSGDVNTVAFTRDGNSVLTGSEDGTIRLWDKNSGISTRRMVGHTGAVLSIAVSSDGAFVLSASKDRTARLWNITSGKEVHRYIGHVSSVWNAFFSPNGKSIVTASSDQTIRIWNTASGRELKRLSSNSGIIRTAIYSNDGSRIYSMGDDGRLLTWDAASGRRLSAFSIKNENSFAYEFSVDRRTLLTGFDKGGAAFWDVTTGRELRRLKLDSSSLSAAAFSFDQRFVIVSAPNQFVNLRVLGIPNGEDVFNRTPATLQVNAPALSTVSVGSSGRMTPESGQVIFESLEPGTVSVVVKLFNGETEMRSVELFPGEKVNVRFDFPARERTLTFINSPNGALIEVNGVLISGQSVKITENFANIRISLTGYESFTTSIGVAANENIKILVPVLKPKAAFITATDLPSDAVLTVNGVVKIGRFSLVPGIYTFRVEAPGFSPYEEIVTLSPGDVFTFRPTLKRS